MKISTRTIFIGIVALLLIIGLISWFIFNKGTTSTVGTSSLGGSPFSNALAPQNKNAATVPQDLAEHTQYYDVDLKYPSDTPLSQSAGSAANASAIQIMKTFIQSTDSGFKQDSGLDNPSASDVQALNGQKESVSSTYQLYTSPTTVSYIFTVSEDTLGAHPNSYFKSFVFDAKTGTQLQLSDLFVDGSDYLDELSSVSRDTLTTQEGTAADPDFINPGTTATTDNFSNFAINGSNLMIFFPPYAVAPYSSGAETISIPFSKLSDVLSPMYKS